MLRLVQHIISSDIRLKLFAFHSLDTLKISQYEVLSSNREMLHITFDPDALLFRFAYHANEGTGQPEFYREYSQASVEKKFDQFVGWIG